MTGVAMTIGYRIDCINYFDQSNRTKALKGQGDFKKKAISKSLYRIVQSERTSCPIRGKELQSETTSCPIRGNELLIRGNELLIHENGLPNSI